MSRAVMEESKEGKAPAAGTETGSATKAASAESSSAEKDVAEMSSDELLRHPVMRRLLLDPLSGIIKGADAIQP